MEEHTIEVVLVLLGVITTLIGWMWNRLHKRVEEAFTEISKVHKRIDDVLLRDPGTRGRSTD